MFLDIKTERLEKWLNNVRSVREEYEKGTHTSHSCHHCIDAESNQTSGRFRLPEDEKVIIRSVCDDCIWVIIEKEKCGDYLVREGNAFTSASNIHHKDKHIARCDRWIDLIQKELERRNKK
ncbi:MAG: hypothetical protein AB7D38_12015 [Sulfurimonas sp.]|uniref:hypothetical protein n=1 Tax=Sulfurimonas sp. TaxID=2022749 RepID=UPI003D0F3B70